MTDQPLDSESWSLTCWYVKDLCPHCDNAVLVTNGQLVWCGWCGYSRKPCQERALDDDEMPDFSGEGLA